MAAEVVLEFAQLAHIAVSTRWHDQLREDLSSGRAMVLPHSKVCTNSDSWCYRESAVLSNPYAFLIEGQERAVYVPSCRTGGEWGRVKMAVAAVCNARGWVLGDKDRVPALVRNGRFLAEWDAAIKAAPPMIFGGPSGCLPYYRHRAAAAQFAKLVPRLRCTCGRLLPRGVREVPAIHTYLVLDAPFVKIGRARDVVRKWRAGRATYNPRKVTLLGTRCGDVESSLHLKFDDLRHRGEWFWDRPSIRAEFGLKTP